MLFLLAVTILADLLGLSNLAVYVAQAAVWTGLAVLLFWFLWLAGETIIHHLLHPDRAGPGNAYPARAGIAAAASMTSAAWCSPSSWGPR